MDFREFVYLGLGSVWFVDFDIAHRDLGIETMVSIEAEDVAYTRARFNKPYRTIEVHYGFSHDVVPTLLETREDLNGRPWIIWLDYDKEMDETRLTELEWLVMFLPPNSFLVTTFNAHPARYADKPVERRDAFVELFKDAFPVEDFPTTTETRDKVKVMAGLAAATLGRMQSKALSISREGGFVPMFNLQYQDSSPMVTVGGMLPNPTGAEEATTLINQPDWPGVGPLPITTPPLTQKEVMAIRSLLPDANPITRERIQALGFDLLEDQIDAFVTYYLKYPSFVQTAR